MATREQIEANRRNSRLSTGPKDTSLSRFNGLKHGLCAVEVGLPGEDPAEVQAEFDGWRGDWQPLTHTRAVLVDLAAVATWRLRRSIRAGSAVRSRLADDAGRAFDSERLAAVERAIDRFDDDPGAALSLLGSTALGIDRLLTSWGELDASLEDGPAGWDQRFHLRLMILLGHPHGTPLFTAGPVPIASAAAAGGARPAPSRCRRGRRRRRWRRCAGRRPRRWPGSGSGATTPPTRLRPVAGPWRRPRPTRRTSFGWCIATRWTTSGRSAGRCGS